MAARLLRAVRTGGGGPGYEFDDEDLAGATYPVGTLAMANAGQDTNGSQFFLPYGDDQLPPNSTVLGRVTSGLEVLQAIGARGSDDRNGVGDGRPVEPVTVTTVETS